MSKMKWKCHSKNSHWGTARYFLFSPTREVIAEIGFSTQYSIGYTNEFGTKKCYTMLVKVGGIRQDYVKIKDKYGDIFYDIDRIKGDVKDYRFKTKKERDEAFRKLKIELIQQLSS